MRVLFFNAALDLQKVIGPFSWKFRALVFGQLGRINLDITIGRFLTELLQFRFELKTQQQRD